MGVSSSLSPAAAHPSATSSAHGQFAVCQQQQQQQQRPSLRSGILNVNDGHFEVHKARQSQAAADHAMLARLVTEGAVAATTESSFFAMR